MSTHPLSGLKARRIATGIAPQDLAHAIGVAINTYYRYEAGTRRIYLDKAIVLADMLGTTVSDLANHDEPVRRTVRHGAEGSVDGTVVSIDTAVPEGWDVE